MIELTFWNPKTQTEFTNIYFDDDMISITNHAINNGEPTMIQIKDLLEDFNLVNSLYNYHCDHTKLPIMGITQFRMDVSYE